MTISKKRSVNFKHDLKLSYSDCASLQASDLIDTIQAKSKEWNVPVKCMIFFADIDTGYYDDSATLECYLEGSRVETDYEYEIRIAIEAFRDAEAKRKKRKENKDRLDKLKQEEYDTYLRLKSKYEK